LQKKAKGSELLDKVFQHLELTERDYFGLKFCQNESEVSHRRGKNYYLIVQSPNISSLTPFGLCLSAAVARSEQKRAEAVAEGAEEWIVDACAGVSSEILCRRSESAAGGVHEISVLSADQAGHLEWETAGDAANGLSAGELPGSM
jgi:hypothetical protein